MFAMFTALAWMVMRPSALLSIALLTGVALLWRGRVAAARRWITGALAAMFIVGTTPLGELLIERLEDRFPRPDLAGASIDGFVVLGGAEDGRVGGARKVIAVGDAGERYIEAVVLARRFPKARVVFSGGSHPLSGATEPEARSAARIFEALGVAGERMTLEDMSVTTWENAMFSAPLIAQKPGERWLLVTSAWQMPRAIGAFRKAGVTLEAYPVDYRTTGRESIFRLNGSLMDGLGRFDGVVREYPGLLIYWLTGRSSALFPAP